MINKYLLLIPFLLLSCNPNDYELVNFQWIGKGGTTGVHFTLGRIKSVELLVPKGYVDSNYYYGEGVITSLIFPDSARLDLHIGYLMKLPYTDYRSHIDSLSNEFKIDRMGTENGKYWREVKLKEYPITIYYYDVGDKNKNKYDSVIESLRLEKIEKAL